MAPPRIPLNFFAMSFGLAGLAGCWVAAGEEGKVSDVAGEAFLALSAAVWIVTLVCYLRYALSRRGALVADLVDPVAAPFSSLAVITPMPLAAQGIAPHAPTAGKVLVDIFLVLTVLLGGWITGQWIYGPLAFDKLHPGYFLPTVAGGFVASASAAGVGQRRLAEVMFGLALVCWFLLGSMILARLFFRPPLPALLVPTLAIEIAPPTVGSIAYFALNGDRVDVVAAGLAGYALVMVLAQLRLLPLFLGLKFAPSTWAFAFSWAAVVTTTMRWNAWGQPSGQDVYTYLLLAAITAFIGAIAARTVLALVRRDLLPPGPGPSPAPGP